MADKNKQEQIEKIRERKKNTREQQKRIRQANKSLLVMPKKTQRSLNLIQYDPEGVFHFLDGRWMKVLKVTGGMENIPESILKINARCVLTKRIQGGKATYYLTLHRSGDIYEKVRCAFLEDEEILRKSLTIEDLSVEETLQEINGLTALMDKGFDFQEFRKKRRDLLPECVPKIAEGYESFFMKDAEGICLFILQYPKDASKVCQMDCKSADLLFIVTDLENVTEEEAKEHETLLRSRYTGIPEDKKMPPLVSVKTYVCMICHDKESLKAAKKEIEDRLTDAGFVTAPVFGQQQDAAVSILTLGMTDLKGRQLVPVDTVKEFMKEGMT